MSQSETSRITHPLPSGLRPHRQTLDRILRLQNRFDIALGIKNQGILNYNPVLARWKFEDVAEGEDRQRWKNYELFQVETALRERNHAAKSVAAYLFDQEGNRYNELFPDEPFDVVLERGQAYRMENGSTELEREQSEIDGWREIMDTLKNPGTPLGIKAVVVSGPGIVEDTNYKDNYVDIYEARKDPDTHKRYVRMTRFNSSLVYNQYLTKAKNIDPNYFTGIDKPIDAWFLSHPFYIHPNSQFASADDIFNHLFERRKDAMKEEDFQALFKSCLPVILFYIDCLSEEPFNPLKIALAWNAILNKSDLFGESKKREREHTSLTEFRIIPPLFMNISEEVDWLGRQPVKRVTAGCGPSVGFNTDKKKSDSSYSSFLSNSVGKFAFEEENDEFGPRSFNCPECGIKNTRPVHELLPACTNCGSTKVCAPKKSA